MPEISLIIPVYNKEKYIRTCLDSLINQTYKDIEIICVDDGSCDESFNILKEYEKVDSRIIVIHQDNRGAGNARNVGIKSARGKYMQFLDADDFFEIDMVEKMYYRAEELHTDIVICNALQYDDETGIEEEHAWLRYQFVYNEPFSYKDVNNIFNITTSCIWNKLYNTEFIRNNNIWYQEIKTNNDTAFAIISLLLANRIACVDEPFVHYRSYEDPNRIANSRDKHMECSILAYKKVKEELKERGKYTAEIDKLLNRQMYCSATYELSFCKDNAKAKKYIRQFSKIINGAEKQKLKYIYDGFINLRSFYLFGKFPVLKSINLSNRKIFYMFNVVPITIYKK